MSYVICDVTQWDSHPVFNRLCTTPAVSLDPCSKAFCSLEALPWEHNPTMVMVQPPLMGVERRRSLVEPWGIKWCHQSTSCCGEPSGGLLISPWTKGPGFPLHLLLASTYRVGLWVFTLYAPKTPVLVGGQVQWRSSQACRWTAVDVEFTGDCYIQLSPWFYTLCMLQQGGSRSGTWIPSFLAPVLLWIAFPRSWGSTVVEQDRKSCVQSPCGAVRTGSPGPCVADVWEAAGMHCGKPGHSVTASLSLPKPVGWNQLKFKILFKKKPACPGLPCQPVLHHIVNIKPGSLHPAFNSFSFIF